MKTISIWESYAEGYIDQKIYNKIHKDCTGLLTKKSGLDAHYEVDHMALSEIPNCYKSLGRNPKVTIETISLVMNMPNTYY